MIRLTVLYPQTADSHFDMAYYLDTHIPLVKERLTPMGLIGVDLQEGLFSGAPETPPPYAMITGLIFNTVEEMGTHGPELLGDIPNFTNVAPQTQVCQVL
ncbi:MAG: EthD family reductase [Bacteroidetes bacterium]|nr:EthD family reductase [Fibrella sp.]